MKGNVQFTILPEATCKEPIIGDLNGDCKVDLKDLDMLSDVWLKCNLEPQETCRE
jgi:hypothetical protein